MPLPKPVLVSSAGAELASDDDAVREFSKLNFQQAIEKIHRDEVSFIGVWLEERNPHLDLLLSAFCNSRGSINALVHFVSDEPQPSIVSQVFEYGFDQFVGTQLAMIHMQNALCLAQQGLKDNDLAFAIINKSMSSIKVARQDDISGLLPELTKYANFDYAAAFTLGKVFVALSNFPRALEWFQKALDLNHYFIPAKTGLAEVLIISGKTTHALEILLRCEQANQNFIERKMLLAVAYIESGDVRKARSFVQSACEIDSEHPRTKEAQAYLLIHEGKLAEAQVFIETITGAGPLFMAKLNDAGISLSQNGKGTAALALYEKAHKIVRSELRYKISMNSALAAHRVGQYALACEFLDRCEAEYGSKFEKLEKVRSVVSKNLKQGAA